MPGRYLKKVRASDYLETGPEPIAGSTRMNAGTAQRIALSLLSSLVMIRLGKVYAGLMVDVQASNAKIAERRENMLIHLTGSSGEDVREALKRARGSVARCFRAGASWTKPRGFSIVPAASSGRLWRSLRRDVPTQEVCDQEIGCARGMQLERRFCSSCMTTRAGSIRIHMHPRHRRRSVVAPGGA
jgi:hypothetical protein